MKKAVLLTLSLALAAIKPSVDNGPHIENHTSCIMQVTLETSCSGEAIVDYALTPDSDITLSTTILPQMTYNARFCMTIKPNCSDQSNNDIQIVSPFFHNNCIISLKNINDERHIFLDDRCFSAN